MRHPRAVPGSRAAPHVKYPEVSRQRVGHAVCSGGLHRREPTKKAGPMPNQKPIMFVSAGQPHYRNEPNRVKVIAIPLIAAAALMGCAMDAMPIEDDEASETQTLFGGVLDTDLVKVTGDQVDFGGAVWGINSPVGSGTMTWSIVDGFYTPRLTGTLHMKDADGKFARMHISYWDGAGGHIATRHGGIVQASGNAHQS